MVPSASCQEAGLHEAAFSLDGVLLTACLPFTPDHVESSNAKDFLQSAAAVRRRPYASLTIYAVPYGILPASGVFPPAAPGIANAYRQLLKEHALSENRQIQDASSVELFGQQVAGLTSLVEGQDRKAILGANLVSEWIVEAGRRVWIVRFSQDNTATTSVPMADVTPATPTRLSLRSPDVDQPSSSLAALIDARDKTGPTSGDGPTASQPTGDLPFPSWWNGDCDVNNFPGSYPLGAAYRGVKACGPLGTARLVSFGVGVSQYEWQCPEYSKRYLYLAYGIAPYSANGNRVVWNCPDPRLDKVSNGTANRAPRSGDVLSYDGTDGYGHTSVVTASSVDSNGNGTIWVAQQNATANGSGQHFVTN
jgi:hypothetical protein